MVSLSIGVKMTEIEKEIRQHYSEMQVPSLSYEYAPGKFAAISQYGYWMESGFENKESAEDWVIDFYSKNIQYIRQGN